MHFSDHELIILGIIDLVIVYLFCILQISYNTLTAIYIKKANNPIARIELWRAYLFAMAPIVYSILPILLILYLYIPTSGTIDAHYPGWKQAVDLIYLHLPPIIIVFSVIIAWNIICTIHNRKYKNLSYLTNIETYALDQEAISYGTNTKNIFRKAIYKWYLKNKQKIEQIKNTKNIEELFKMVKLVQGWYVAKQRFQFFWITKKRYAWIKKYYFSYYMSLMNSIKITYIQIANNC